MLEWTYNEHNYIHQHYLLTYLLTPWCRVLLEKLTGLQLVKKFPAFHETRRFITALTRLRQLSLSWASPLQSIYPHPTPWRSILILSIHLSLCLPSGLFPSGFPTKTLYAPLYSPIRAACPAHLILLDFITRTILGEEYKSFSSSLYKRMWIIELKAVRRCIETVWHSSLRLLSRRLKYLTQYRNCSVPYNYSTVSSTAWFNPSHSSTVQNLLRL